MKRHFEVIVSLFLLCFATVGFSQDFTIETSSGGSSLNYTQFISYGDTATGWIKITNVTNKTILVTLLTQTDYHYNEDFVRINGSDLHSVTFPILPNGSVIDTVRFIPQYKREMNDNFMGTTRAFYSITDTSNQRYELPVWHNIAPTFDSLILPLSYNNYASYEISDVPAKTTTCVPNYILNNSKKPIIITQVYDIYSDDPSLAISENYKYPLIILPGEKVNILNICYSPKAPNLHDINGYGTIVYIIGNSAYTIRLSVIASSSIDTLLLKPCFNAYIDSNVFGPILLNGTFARTINLKSNRTTPITITNAVSNWSDTEAFSVVGNPFPLTLAPLGTNSFKIQFTPKTIKPYVKYRYASNIIIQSGLCSAGFVIIGLAITPTDPATATPLFPNDSEQLLLAMSGTGQSFSQKFYFYNNQTKNIKVTSVSLRDNTSGYSIGNITPTNSLPFTLAPGDSMSIAINLSTSSPDVLYNELIINTELGLQALQFHLQGLRTNTNAAVRDTKHTPVNITVSPNPSSGDVHIITTGVESPSIEIFDVLGNRVNEIQNSNEYHWSATTNGSYFARISGYTDNGKPFVETKKVVVRK